MDTSHNCEPHKNAPVSQYSDERAKFLLDLATIGITMVSGHGWVYKALYNGKGIDCFFPEEAGGEYTDEELEAAAEGRAEMRLWKEAKL